VKEVVIEEVKVVVVENALLEVLLIELVLAMGV
jgi:hypothetical protein